MARYNKKHYRKRRARRAAAPYRKRRAAAVRRVVRRVHRRRYIRPAMTHAAARYGRRVGYRRHQRRGLSLYSATRPNREGIKLHFVQKDPVYHTWKFDQTDPLSKPALLNVEDTWLPPASAQPVESAMFDGYRCKRLKRVWFVIKDIRTNYRELTALPALTTPFAVDSSQGAQFFPMKRLRFNRYDKSYSTNPHVPDTAVVERCKTFWMKPRGHAVAGKLKFHTHLIKSSTSTYDNIYNTYSAAVADGLQQFLQDYGNPSLVATAGELAQPTMNTYLFPSPPYNPADYFSGTQGIRVGHVALEGRLEVHSEWTCWNQAA